MKINSISGLVYRVKDLDETVEFGGQREFLMNDPDGNKLAFFAKK
jgi:hypothetical protein